ncbi:MAG: LPS export ABC transporter periplasmic protein LptC [Bacteroidota bacterium]
MAVLALTTGCENDIERINLITDETKTPAVKGTNVKVIYSDSARIKVQILAPSFLQFPNVERPYMEFPDGLDVFFYNDSQIIESEIRSDHTIYYMEERLWHATGNVVAQSLANGDALNTEELYWDEASEMIYSETFTKIQNEDGTFYGKQGFESNQNLTNWQLKGTSGTVNVQDEE